LFAPGGLYLLARVPEYGELRTFAVDRIRSISVSEERFTPAELAGDAFAHSLGVNEGPPEHIEIAFEPRIAPYVRGRRWHASQQIGDRADGAVVMSLDVCNDWALRSWILSFGPLARVLAPEALAAQIRDELERARSVYATLE
ncbi:MAG: transcriptional regulator, partial [Acidobacteria bacterium]